MNNFIDRNPDEMLRFANQAKQYASNMVYSIRTMQGLLEAYKSSLDDNCQQALEKLDQDINVFLNQVKVYDELAADIEKKAKRQKDISF